MRGRTKVPVGLLAGDAALVRLALGHDRMFRC